MRPINLHEVKTHLYRLVEEAAAGYGFLLYTAGKPMVQVTSIDQHTSPKLLPQRLGLLESQCSIPEDFNRLGSETIADLFEGV